MKALRPARATAPPSPIGEPLRNAVDRQGLSATALAHASGVDVRSVSRWLRGDKDLTLATADRIATALGVRVVDAGRRRDPAPPRRPADRPAPPPDGSPGA